MHIEKRSRKEQKRGEESVLKCTIYIYIYIVRDSEYTRWKSESFLSFFRFERNERINEKKKKKGNARIEKKLEQREKKEREKRREEWW